MPVAVGPPIRCRGSCTLCCERIYPRANPQPPARYRMTVGISGLKSRRWVREITQSSHAKVGASRGRSVPDRHTGFPLPKKDELSYRCAKYALTRPPSAESIRANPTRSNWTTLSTSPATRGSQNPSRLPSCLRSVQGSFASAGSHWMIGAFSRRESSNEMLGHPSLLSTGCLWHPAHARSSAQPVRNHRHSWENSLIAQSIVPTPHSGENLPELGASSIERPY